MLLTNHRPDDQAYWVAFLFLDEFWKANRQAYNDDLPVLLAAMEIMINGVPADSAYVFYWAEMTDSKPVLTLDETYAATIRLLEHYRALGEEEAKDITRLLDELVVSPDKHRATWERIAQQVINSA